MVADGSRQPRCYSLKRAPQHQPLGDPHLAARRAAHLRAEAPAGDGPIAGEGDARVQGLHLRQGRPCRVAAAAGRDRRPGRHAPRRNRFVRRHDEAAATAAAHRGGDPRRAPRRVADPARHHPPHPRRRLRLPRPPHRLAQPGPARGQSQAGHARSHRAFRHLDQGQSLRRVRTRSAGHPVAALELSGARDRGVCAKGRRRFRRARHRALRRRPRVCVLARPARGGPLPHELRREPLHDPGSGELLLLVRGVHARGDRPRLRAADLRSRPRPAGRAHDRHATKEPPHRLRGHGRDRHRLAHDRPGLAPLRGRAVAPALRALDLAGGADGAALAALERDRARSSPVTFPKIELHVHLEGTVRPETLLEIARRNEYALPADTVEGLAALYEYRDFAHFVEVWILTTHALRTADDFRRVVVDYAAEAASHGAVYIEGIFSPAERVRRGVSWDEIFSGYCDGAQQAEELHGVTVRLTPDIFRSATLEEAEAVVRHSAAYRKRGIVAVGLGGREAEYPPEPYEGPFALARAEGLGSVPHAGEHAGAASVRGALETLGADRLRHGIRAVEDDGLVRELADRSTVLDVCPISNLRTGAVRSLAEHPLPKLVAAGVRCSISTDDPAMFDTDLTRDYEAARSLGLDASSAYEAGVAGALCGEETRKRLRRIGAAFAWSTTAQPELV